MIKICKGNLKLVSLLVVIIIILISILFSTNEINLEIEYPESKKEIIERKNQTKVVRVVDGDTIILYINGKDERVRLVGLNTPESKKINGRVVECFGKEATKKAKEDLILNQKVFFEYDESQSKRDKYGRLLGYIFLESGQNFAELMIKDGYGYEYTYKGRVYKYQKEFRKAQKYAENNKLGLWSKDACN